MVDNIVGFFKSTLTVTKTKNINYNDNPVTNTILMPIPMPIPKQNNASSYTEIDLLPIYTDKGQEQGTEGDEGDGLSAFGEDTDTMKDELRNFLKNQ